VEALIKEEGKFKYIDQGEGPVLLLLHGLFGALSNFRFIVDEFSARYRVIIPILPLYELPIEEANLKGLVDHTYDFIKYKNLNDCILLGNSLGGHLALLTALQHPERVKAMVLTGSSGLFENTFGGSFPKRGDYDYIKEKTEYTFYDPLTATKDLVDEVYDIVNDKNKAFRVISVARSAMRQNMADELPKIKVPVLLIWGKNDNITPEFVGEEFHKLLPNSELKLMDKSGHAPMMEKPEEFNVLLTEFLDKLKIPAAHESH
jgi:pimeloyl-ACP methyl ester carboxylesterase